MQMQLKTLGMTMTLHTFFDGDEFPEYTLQLLRIIC